MVKMTGLFTDSDDMPDTTVDSSEIWDNTKADIKHSIDLALDRGKVDRETLEIMKELLEVIKPVTTMEEYMEDDESGC